MAGLIRDARGRHIDYARISVTDRCNLRCVYCMPEDGVPVLAHDDIMRYEEIMFLCSVLSSLGVRKVRFTGGEPLVRKGLIPFLADFRKCFPDIAISLTTNASLLERYAGRLAEIGLSGINISLDTLDPENFRQITRVGDIKDVLAGISSSVAAGIPDIKTNTVLMRGVNDGELTRLLSYAWGKGITPRLIEFMPLGDDVWRGEKFIGADEILASLTKRYGEWKPLDESSSGAAPPHGPAKYYASPQNRTVGIITAVSDHFCSECNRLRVTASGHMRSCLFSRAQTSLLELLRNGDTDAVKEAILSGINAKPDWWESERDGLLRMSDIGG
jgi:cyclic pyranopterin phosphate synthase